MILQFRVLLLNVCGSLDGSCVDRMFQQFCFHLPSHLWLYATCSAILSGGKDRLSHNTGSFFRVSRVVWHVCMWTVRYSMFSSAVSCLVSMSWNACRHETMICFFCANILELWNLHLANIIILGLDTFQVLTPQIFIFNCNARKFFPGVSEKMQPTI